MKHTTMVIIPATTREVAVSVTCDLCGDRVDDLRDNYEVNEVEIRHKTGSSYPEGGSGIETSVGMCGKCFDEKLVPWLRSQGAEPRDEDWDN